ncbi:hypothetical protein ABPG72_018235 [Tetrahymena utriculariae]
MIRTQNQFLSKAINGKVKLQQNHSKSLAHVELLYENKELLEIENIFQKNSILVNTWYHQNITNLHKLDQKAQKIANSFFSLSVLQRVFDYSEQKSYNLNKRVLLPNHFYLAFQEQGLLFLNGKNATFKNIPPQENCQKGLYQFDPRCTEWFKEGSLKHFIQILNQKLLNQNISDQLTMTQYLNSENENRNEDFISLLGYQFSFQFIQDYFQNYGNSTKQIYFINPQSQIIYYDYNKQQCNSSTNIKTLSDCELKYLQSTQEQKKLNDQIFNNFHQCTKEKIAFKEVIDLIQSNTITFPYNRNGSKSQFILSPIYLFDKTNSYMNITNKSDRWIQTPLLQIHIISNENTIQILNQIDQSFKSYFIIVNIMLVIVGLLCIALTIFYSNKIIIFFYTSLEQIIEILEEMNSSTFSKKIFEIDIENFFLSEETQDLYQSIKQIYFSLVSMSKEFFVKDQTEVLLNLSQSLEFFKLFKNQHALGIIYNNMGSILLNQGFYLQSIKLYSEAIIFAKYSIQEFCNDNPFSKTSESLLKFTFLFDQPSNYYKKLKNASTRDKLKSTVFMKSSNQEIQSMSMKTEDFSKNQNISKTTTIDILLRKIQELKRNSRQKSNSQIDRITLSQQAIYLVQNLFNRKRNFIIALINYQECIDQQKSQQESYLHNFWLEIKNLLKELLSISKYLPLKNYQQIEIFLLISKCQTQLSKKEKSIYIIQLCEEYLKLLQGQYQKYKTLSIYQLILPQNISKNNPDSFLKKKRQSQNQNLNNLTISLFDEKTLVDKRKSRKPTVLMNSNVLNEKNLIGDQNYSLAQSSQMLNNQETQTKQIQTTNQNVQKSQGIDMDFSAINLVQSIEITKLDDDNCQQNKFFETHKDSFIQNYQMKQSKFNKFQSTQNSKIEFMNDQNNNQISKNNFQNSVNKIDKSCQSINQSKDKIKSKFIQKSKLIFTKLQLEQKLKSKQELNNNNNTQSKNENCRYNFEEQFQKNRKKLKKLENQYQVFNYYSTKNLQIITKFTKAEYYLNNYEEQTAAKILTQILEESHFTVSNYPYLILNKLNHIFHKANIKSKEFDVMYQKFNPEIYFQIGVVFACGLNSEQIFNSTKLTSDMVGNILNSDKDQLGIFLVEIQDIQFNQYMAYTKLKTVKEMMKQIIADIFRFTTLKKDFLKLTQICDNLNAFNNENKQFNIATETDKSQNFDQQNQTLYSFAYDQDEYMNKLSESFDQQFRNQMDSESSNNIQKTFYEKSNLNIKSLSDINACNYYQQNLSFSNFDKDQNNVQPKNYSDLENNYLSLHQQVSQNNLNNTDTNLSNRIQRRHTIQCHNKSNNESQQKIKNRSIKQLPYSNFDTITVQNLSLLNESVKAENYQFSQDSFEVEANFLNNLDRNHQFYISIRMALKEFYDKDIVLKYQQNFSDQNLNKPKNNCKSMQHFGNVERVQKLKFQHLFIDDNIFLLLKKQKKEKTNKNWISEEVINLDFSQLNLRDVEGK